MSESESRVLWLASVLVKQSSAVALAARSAQQATAHRARVEAYSRDIRAALLPGALALESVAHAHYGAQRGVELRRAIELAEYQDRDRSVVPTFVAAGRALLAARDTGDSEVEAVLQARPEVV